MTKKTADLGSVPKTREASPAPVARPRAKGLSVKVSGGARTGHNIELAGESALCEIFGTSDRLLRAMVWAGYPVKNACAWGVYRLLSARDLGIAYPRVEYHGSDPLAYVIHTTCTAAT